MRPPPAPPEFDTALVGRLAALLGAAAVEELLADAALALADRRRHLAETLAADGPDARDDAAQAAALARIGHDLAAMAGQIGLAAVAGAARDLEARARAAGPGRDADPALDAAGRRLLSALERGSRALAAYRARPQHGIASGDSAK